MTKSTENRNISDAPTPFLIETSSSFCFEKIKTKKQNGMHTKNCIFKKNDNLLLSKESNKATSYIQIFLSGRDNFCSILSSKFFYPYLYLSPSQIVVITKHLEIHLGTYLIVTNLGL